MNPTEALEIVIHEGTAFDGMVVETRAGIDPGLPRVHRLRDALALLASELASAPTLDRRLANALYGLSFHLSATLDHWQNCAWIDEYTEILEAIEAIFEGSSEAGGESTRFG